MTKARAGQIQAETAYLATPKARAGQVGIEVAYLDSGVTPATGTPTFFAQIIG